MPKFNTATITTPIIAQSNTEYDFTGATITRATRGFCFVIPAGVNGVTVKGGTFVGGGFDVPDTLGTKIIGPTVRDTFPGAEGGDSMGFRFGHFREGRMELCKVLNVPHTAVWFWSTLHRSIVTRNYLEGCGEGFHSFHRGGVTSEDVQFTFNEVRKCGRHAYELQNYGKMYRWRVANNIAHDWVTRADWPGHMAFSLAVGQSDGMNGVELDKGPPPYINDDFIVEDNVAIADGQWLANGTNSSTAFELMGNFTFRRNYCSGWSQVTLSEYTRPNKHSYYDNVYLTTNGARPVEATFVGYQGPPSRNDGHYYGRIGDKPVPTNVGPSASPTPLPPDPGPTPMPPTLSNPAKTSTSLTVAATGGTKPYKLSFKTRDGTDTPTVLSSNWDGAAYIIAALNPNWVYTVFATGKDGAVARADYQCLASDPVVPPTAKRKAVKIIYDDQSEQVIA